MLKVHASSGTLRDGMSFAVLHKKHCIIPTLRREKECKNFGYIIYPDIATLQYVCIGAGFRKLDVDVLNMSEYIYIIN
jgi:hypothetical protein